jgi:dinuclear metal center YbgI/SA1388 family protein
MKMQLKELCKFCDDYLNIHNFKDYCPNGLQVESTVEVSKLVTGVTASMALIEAAIEEGADTLLVHHGYFWKGEGAPLVGNKGRRIASLIRNNINLIAYHLPLDVHSGVGNNTQLGKLMGWTVDGGYVEVGGKPLVLSARADGELSLEQLTALMGKKLGNSPLAISGGSHTIKRIAWCTGAAQNYLEAVADEGADVFVSGEISENTVHFAREAGIHYIAAGHHATERYGVQALASVIEQKFGLPNKFIDIPNPV